ncbi:hypothetical protein TNCV_4510501 [Trichonephila clavipes]|nr:hypothetical protein TNCV_4510501 [Trichonephila clavipes]
MINSRLYCTTTVLRLHARNNFRKYHTLQKQKANHCLPFLLGADQQWSCHFERFATLQRIRGKTRCIEVLLTTSHSVLAISIIVPWKEKSQNTIYFLTFPVFENIMELSRQIASPNLEIDSKVKNFSGVNFSLKTHELLHKIKEEITKDLNK